MHLHNNYHSRYIIRHMGVSYQSRTLCLFFDQRSDLFMVGAKCIICHFFHHLLIRSDPLSDQVQERAQNHDSRRKLPIQTSIKTILDGCSCRGLVHPYICDRASYHAITRRYRRIRGSSRRRAHSLCPPPTEKPQPHKKPGHPHCG